MQYTEISEFRATRVNAESPEQALKMLMYYTSYLERCFLISPAKHAAYSRERCHPFLNYGNAITRTLGVKPP